MKPNLIVIMADQLRSDVLERGYTPNIDSLRNDSMKFSNAYCASPLCVPARGAFFTGLCPNTNGSMINPWEAKDSYYGDVHNNVDNLYQLMEKDWYSIHSGKQHLFTEGGKLEDRDENIIWASTEKTYKEMLKENNVRQPGLLPKFKSYVPETVSGEVTRVSKYSNAETGLYPYDEEYYFDRYFTKKALEALKERDKSKPLFLSAMFLAPHPPFEIPDPWFSKLTLDEVTLPENCGKYYQYQSPLQMYNLTGVIGSHYTLEQWKEAWRVYLGLVSMLDKSVGEIISELKKDGTYNDSMIIFTADHGEMLGSHRLFQKMCMYEESSHIPLSVKMPKNSSIGTFTSPVSHLDIMPTLCEYFGLESKNEFEGHSLMPILNGEKDINWNNDIFIQYDGNGSRSNFQRCIISGNYKLIADLFKDEVFVELYDLSKDRIESENLAFQEEYDNTLSSMYEKLARHMVETKDMLSLPSLDLNLFREKHSSFKVKM